MKIGEWRSLPQARKELALEAADRDWPVNEDGESAHSPGDGCECIWIQRWNDGLRSARYILVSTESN